MAKTSPGLANIISYAKSAYGAEVPDDLRLDVLQSELGQVDDEDDRPRAAEGHRETAAWRSLLASIPLDAGSFAALYGRDEEDARRSNFRRHVVDDLARWCDQLAEAAAEQAWSSSQPTSARSFGYLGVLFLTLLTMEDADDRRFEDLANRNLDAADYDPANAGQTAAEVHALTCRRLINSVEVRHALHQLYEPPWSKDDQSAYSGIGMPAVGEVTAGNLRGSVRDVVDARRAKDWWDKEVDFTQLTFHRCGTTSFIVRTARRSDATGPGIALKFVLFPYAELAAIAQASRQYFRDFGAASRDAREAVSIWASTSNFIIMDFVPGMTLTEYVWANYRATGTAGEPLRRPRRRRAENRADTSNRFADERALRELAPPLFDALKGLHGAGVVHQDLNPSNIIVQEATGALRFTFVDFGRNYLYDQAGLRRQSADATYIAPEIRRGPQSDGHDAADLYSLGQLIIALSGVGRDAEGVVPDAFYRRTPMLARFLEDLIDRDPAKRLLLLKAKLDGPALYETLAAVFQSDLEAVVAADRKDGLCGPPTPIRRVVLLLGPLSGAVGRQRRLAVALASGSRPPSDPWRQSAPALARWSLLSGVVLYISLAIMTFLLLRDLRIVPAGVVEAVGLPGRAGNDEDFQTLLAARITGITFVLIAVKYYQNIYSGLTTAVARGVTGGLRRRATAAEFFVRLNAVFVALIVVPVNIIQPAWWTIGCAIGLVDSLMVNWTGAMFSLKAVRCARELEGESTDRRPVLSTVPPVIAGLDMYRMWTPSMAAYVGIVLLFAVLINGEVLKDVLAYGIVVGILNVALFHINKCGTNAEPVRIGLVRAYLAAERLAHLPPAGVPASLTGGVNPGSGLNKRSSAQRPSASGDALANLGKIR